MGVPTNRLARLYLKPEKWVPAMGWPPMKVKPYCSARGKHRLQISCLTPQQSMTRASFDTYRALASSHAALPSG